MIDRLFSAALAFTLLAGGTTAIGHEMFQGRPAGRAEVQVVQLPRVEVIGVRTEAAAARIASASSEAPVATVSQ